VVKDHREEWQVLCSQAAVEQDPAKLLKLIARINELLEAKRTRLEGKSLDPAQWRGHKIFQIAYDEILLITRAELLKKRGYEVSSVLGNEDARRVLSKGGDYRVFLVGHAAPQQERQEMARWIRNNFPQAKILALNYPEIGRLPEADFNFILNGPEEWLATIGSVAE
jgi:hypothetical protein